jgi:hypothetical protein
VLFAVDLLPHRKATLQGDLTRALE